MEPQSQRERFRIADLTVDVDAVSVVRDDGRSIELPRLSFDLLVALARRAPAVVGTEELIATVWAGIAISDETLTQRVALLRRALGDDARHPRYLRVVRGRGYQLLPAVEPIGAGASQARPVSHFFAWSAGITALALAAGLVAILAGRFRPPRPGDTLARMTLPSAIVTRSASVSELLERAGGYLSRHQEANNELAIELYQRALTLEPNNADALAGLSLALGQRATKFNRHGTTELRALELARRAVALDPQLGRAHHALGLALDSRGSVNAAIAAYLRAARLEERPAAALASAANLMQVEGRLAEALETDVRAARLGAPDPPLYVEIQIGSTLALLGFEPASTMWFERALELRPDNLFAAAAFARARWSEGRFAEADAIAARGLARGIRRAELPDMRGNVALRQGDRSRAKSLYAAALAVSPADLEARTRLLVLDLERPGDRAARLEHDRQGLLADIRQSRAAGDEWPESAIDETVLETAAGNRDAAFRGLDVAIGLGYRDLGALNVDPLLAPLRSDPRFGPRVERLRGLVDAERQRVLGAPWLPPALLAGTAARM
jgi:DNA-binding winged helix-turn-helix (wHTH) protein/tetratricopeptide (TPR) repeat protein